MIHATKEPAINRSYHIPYLAGYSQDGKTIYIDKRLPRGFSSKGRYVTADKYLAIHEGTEKGLIDDGKTYGEAHKIATTKEYAAVEADGVDIEDYKKFMAEWVKKINSGVVLVSPKDLDLTPYRFEKDTKNLMRLKRAMH